MVGESVACACLIGTPQPQLKTSAPASVTNTTVADSSMVSTLDAPETVGRPGSRPLAIPPG